MRSDQRDSYRTRMTATVRSASREDGATWLGLSDSVFYPTSGGQPHDTGVLRFDEGVSTVVEVVSDGPQGVLHRVEGPVPGEGASVEGEIDWDRRYRHMQRHSAQHLLSQAFLRVDASFETRSVSLTSADATIDLAGEPEDTAIDAAFDLARRWAYATMPIDAFEVDESELDAYPLRRPPKVSGTVRLVSMGDVELSACGGTHLRTTAETLPLLALNRQRIRGGLTRVTFRAGLEAGERAARTVALADELGRSLSVPWHELPARLEALRNELREAQTRADEALASWAAERLGAAAREPSGLVGDPPRLDVVRLIEDDPERLAVLAETAARTHPDAVVLLAARTDERASLLFQAGPGAGEVDLRPALDRALALLGGRGGGRPDRVQGAGPRVGQLAAALDAAEASLRRTE